MFHPDTQFLIDHWTILARGSQARAGIPARAALHPDALGLRLPRAFIVQRSGEDANLRLAGSWLEALHGHELKQRNLLSLWTERSHRVVAAALSQAQREGRPVVISALAGEDAALMEISLAPLRGASGRTDVILGLYAPLSPLTPCRDSPCLLTARVSVAVGRASRAPLSLAAERGRRIA